MPAATQPEKMAHSSTDKIDPRETRLLLAVWFLGGEEVNQGQVTNRVKRKQERSADCQTFYTNLIEKSALKISNKKVSLTNEGKSILGQALQASHLEIQGTVVGSWMAKALLKWIQQSGVTMNGAATNGKAKHNKIASYREFEQAVLKVYNQLKRDFNLDDLVPIYRIRREIGEQTSRSQFDEWLLEMQANDIFQLLEGSVEDSAPDKIEDSISTKVSGLRCYAKRLDT